MINTRFLGGGYALPIKSERGTSSVILVPLRLPKGGQRWNNTLKGGVIYG